MNLPFQIRSFFEELIKNYPGVQEIWWIGSRANNNNVRTDSDWDFLVFAKESVYSQIRLNKKFKELSQDLSIDLLVENEKFVFKNVWGVSKTLHMVNDLKWKIVSEKKARYYGTKLIEKEPSDDLFQDKCDKYFAQHGADVTSKDLSAYIDALKIWPKC